MLRGPKALIVVATMGLLGAPSALANAVTSSNWAGYAAHRPGVSFSEVSGTWKQPRASCPRGRRSYSAVWVGLGGYSTSSNALEQIGTEVDCTARGRVVSSAWYELIPAASRPIRMRVAPGDQLTATVAVAGRAVTLTLDNLTRHQSFRKTVIAQPIDVSSADWIVEAPSDCINANTCITLPLANFHSAAFSLASATSSAGHVGTISDPAWSWTRIRLAPHGRRFVSNARARRLAGAASASGLVANGSAFSVTFSRIATYRSPFYSQRVAVRGG